MSMAHRRAISAAARVSDDEAVQVGKACDAGDRAMVFVDEDQGAGAGAESWVMAASCFLDNGLRRPFVP